MVAQHISIYRMRIYMKFFRFAFLLVVILQPCDSIEVRELLGLWGSSHSTLSIYKCWVQSMTDEMSSPQNMNVVACFLMWMYERYVCMQQFSFCLLMRHPSSQGICIRCGICVSSNVLDNCYLPHKLHWIWRGKRELMHTCKVTSHPSMWKPCTL